MGSLMLLFLVLVGYAAASSLFGSDEEPFSGREDYPDPSVVYVRDIVYGGSGCPAGTVSTSFSVDRSSFTLIFDEYIASAGPRTPQREARKNCLINIKLHIPQGWQYTITTVDYRGYVALDPGVSATQKSTYYFTGEIDQSETRVSFQGPLNEDYLTRDVLRTESLIWSPCGENRNLNINSQVRVDNSRDPKGSEGSITTDSVDGTVKQILHFSWRKCEARSL